MNLLGFVSKVFPQLSHICENGCSCSIGIKSSSEYCVASLKSKKRGSENNMSFFGNSSKKACKESEVVNPPADPLSILFSTYADEDNAEIMSMDGIGRLAEDLNLDAQSDPKVLVMCWKLNAALKPGCITKEEFKTGMKSLKCNTLNDLKKKVESFDCGFLENSEFREFNKFVFQFSREGTHKTLEKEVVLALLPIVQTSVRCPHLDHFLRFLSSPACRDTHFTMDQWDSFWLFNRSVSVDLKNFEDNGAWPVLIDEYVEWRQQNQ